MDNENIQLLRLRSFTIGKPLSDEDLQSTGAQDRIAALIGIMEPFVSQQSLPLGAQSLPGSLLRLSASASIGSQSPPYQ